MSSSILDFWWFYHFSKVALFEVANIGNTTFLISIFETHKVIRFIFGTIIANLSYVQLSAQLQGAIDSQNIENQLLKAVIMDVICKKRQRQGYVGLSNI